MDVVMIDYSTGRSDGKRRRKQQNCSGCGSQPVGMFLAGSSQKNKGAGSLRMA